jgi:hypothetical protein
LAPVLIVESDRSYATIAVPIRPEASCRPAISEALSVARKHDRSIQLAAYHFNLARNC